jgi:hypothetical protein
VCQIAAGSSQDCNGDGLPDECQAGQIEHLYLADDGDHDGSFGGVATDMIWLNRFTVSAGAQFITAVEIAWGFIESECVGQPTDIAVWSDPDGDGAPHDARLLRLVRFVPAEHPNTDLVTLVPLSPVFVGQAGDHFFVGAHMKCVLQSDYGWPEEWYPASVDTTPPSHMGSWFATGDNLEDLAGNPYGPVLIDDLGYPGNWLLRGRTAAVRDCDNDGVLDSCAIEADPALDLDGEGILDACMAAGDFNGDGTVDVEDFVTLVLNWGPCPAPAAPCPGDANGDGEVGPADLIVLVTHWS